MVGRKGVDASIEYCLEYEYLYIFAFSARSLFLNHPVEEALSRKRCVCGIGRYGMYVAWAFTWN